MKKIKNKRRFILVGKKRFRKKLRRKKIRDYLRRIHQDNDSAYSVIRRRKARLQIKAKNNKYTVINPPSNFSIVNNPDQTISFFEKIQKSMLEYKPVFVNMADIQSMTVDALVYNIAIMQKMKTKLSDFILKGSFPTDEKILTLMKRSGFLKYLETNEDNIHPHRDYIEIKSGNICDNDVVKKICMFVMKKLNVDRINTLKLYDIIFELMLNTKHHAYENSKNYDNWLLFLSFSSEKNSIDFIFMDTGYGIARTVRKYKIETATAWLSKLGITIFEENDLVHSALNGAFRTKTRKGYRGKGLPRIYKFFNEGYIEKLNILTNKACIKEKERYDLEVEMIGTLYFWTITRESINGNSKN